MSRQDGLLDGNGPAEHFAERGLSRPFRVLGVDDAQRLQALIASKVLPSAGPNRCNEQGRQDNASCRHVDVAEIRELASTPSILAAVRQALGVDDITLFLSRIWTKLPAGSADQEWSSTEVPWHQDSTYFPIEPKISVNAWVALTPAGVGNGGLQVIAASHRQLLASEVLPGTIFPRTRVTERTTFGAGEPVELAAGECFLFSGLLLHRSEQNWSAKPRVGVQFNFVSSATRMPDDFPYRGAVGDRIEFGG